MDKYRIEVKWALIFIAALLIWMLGENLSGLHDQYIAQHAFYTNFFGIVAIGIYLLALYNKRRSYGGYISWQQGFVSGFLLTLFICLLTPVAQLIISLWIAPEYFGKMIEYSVGTGKMSIEEAEATFALSSYIGQSTFFAFASGFATSVVVALIVKRKKPSSPETADLTGI